MLQWRRFQFFDKDLVKNEPAVLAGVGGGGGGVGGDSAAVMPSSLPAAAPHETIERLSISCNTSGGGHIIFGDTGGSIHIFDRSFRCHSFQAFDTLVTHLKHFRHSSHLIAVGDDDGQEPALKIFHIQTPSRSSKSGSSSSSGSSGSSASASANPSSSPTAVDNGGANVVNIAEIHIKTIKLLPLIAPKNSTPISAARLITCIDANDNLTLIALGLHSGSVLFLRGELSRGKSPQSRIIEIDAAKSPITGVAFVRKSNLFVTTEANVTLVRPNAKTESKEEVDRSGAKIGCTILSEEENFVVAKNDAIYFYEPDGLRGPCFAFGDARKNMISWFRNYLILVSENNIEKGKRAFILNIYDLKNKFVAYSGNFPGLASIIVEFGSIFVLAAEEKKAISTAASQKDKGTPSTPEKLWRLYQLTEKDTQTKLEILFKKNLYGIAINLANSSDFEPGFVTDIFRKYGDHLYAKGDYDQAISQYIKTIGHLEPSYVVRKFVENNRIRNLMRYLEELHLSSHANADHTSLLLLCYARSSSSSDKSSSIGSESEIKRRRFFFIEKADSLKISKGELIERMRERGFIEEALTLACKYNEHRWYLKIHIEDLGNHAEAIRYLREVIHDEEQKMEFMKMYGKTLVKQQPAEATAVLIDMFTGTKGGVASKSPSSSRLSEFIKCFIDNPRYLEKFLAAVIDKNPDVEPDIYNTLIEMYLNNISIHYEKMASSSSQSIVAQIQEISDKVMKVLKDSRSQYNPHHILVLLRTQKIPEDLISDPLLFLYEKLGFFSDILGFYMARKDFRNVVDVAKKFGDKQASQHSIWMQVLTWLASIGGAEAEAELHNILTYIDTHNLISPLVVLQILANCTSDDEDLAQSPNPIRVGMIKDFITNRLRSDQEDITADESVVVKYLSETKKLRDEVTELCNSAKIFQLNKCVACTLPLDPPAVHFLCGHSFHYRCLGEGLECLVCEAKNHKVYSYTRSLAESAQQHDMFFKQLEGSSDGFGVVSEYLGRGIFMDYSSGGTLFSGARKGGATRMGALSGSSSSRINHTDNIDDAD